VHKKDNSEHNSTTSAACIVANNIRKKNSSLLHLRAATSFLSHVQNQSFLINNSVLSCYCTSHSLWFAAITGLCNLLCDSCNSFVATCVILRLSGELIVNPCFRHPYFLIVLLSIFPKIYSSAYGFTKPHPPPSPPLLHRHGWMISLPQLQRNSSFMNIHNPDDLIQCRATLNPM
jgi:hypothetical protein